MVSLTSMFKCVLCFLKRGVDVQLFHRCWLCEC